MPASDTNLFKMGTRAAMGQRNKGDKRMPDLLEITKHPLTVAELRLLLADLDGDKPVLIKLTAEDAKEGDEYFLPEESIVNSQNEIVLQMSALNWLATKDDEGKRQFVRDWENRP
jgi:hypothetical protein